MSFSIIGVHQVAHMVDIGITKIAAAWLLGFMAILRAIGGVGGGWIGDRIGRRSTFVVSSLLGMAGVVCLMWLSKSRMILAYLFVLLNGVGAGARGNLVRFAEGGYIPGQEFWPYLGVQPTRSWVSVCGRSLVCRIYF